MYLKSEFSYVVFLIFFAIIVFFFLQQGKSAIDDANGMNKTETAKAIAEAIEKYKRTPSPAVAKPLNQVTKSAYSIVIVSKRL